MADSSRSDAAIRTDRGPGPADRGADRGPTDRGPGPADRGADRGPVRERGGDGEQRAMRARSPVRKRDVKPPEEQQAMMNEVGVNVFKVDREKVRIRQLHVNGVMLSHMCTQLYFPLSSLVKYKSPRIPKPPRAVPQELLALHKVANPWY